MRLSLFVSLRRLFRNIVSWQVIRKIILTCLVKINVIYTEVGLIGMCGHVIAVFLNCERIPRTEQFYFVFVGNLCMSP